MAAGRRDGCFPFPRQERDVPAPLLVLSHGRYNMGMVAHVQQVSATNKAYKQTLFSHCTVPHKKSPGNFYSFDMVAVDLSDAAQEAAVISTLWQSQERLLSQYGDREGGCLARGATTKADVLPMFWLPRWRSPWLKSQCAGPMVQGTSPPVGRVPVPLIRTKPSTYNPAPRASHLQSRL